MILNTIDLQAAQQTRVQEVCKANFLKIAKKTDLLFGYLFIFQWLLGITFAVFVSPKTWAGQFSQIHIHVYAAIFLGGLLASYPVFLIFTNPGTAYNRIVISVSQILFSTLFIYLTGGRIETHFHIFGSLAFLAFYRDGKALAIASFITLLDHLVRGYFWPQSIYGVLSSTPWRAIEHAAWVIFEDLILISSIKIALQESLSLAESQVNLEIQSEAIKKANQEIHELNHFLEIKVKERTRQLEESQQIILSQQEALVNSSKMSALGEMAAGIAHEINNPLAIISIRSEQLSECLADGDFDAGGFQHSLGVIKKTVDRIAKIISGLRFFAREGTRDAFEQVAIAQIIADTLNLCQERFSIHGVQLDLLKDASYDSLAIECRPVEISQVLLNLLNNSFDAIEFLSQKWIKLTVSDLGESIRLSVTDSGTGIAKELREKIMQPFFTTKDIGKGTGLGLSLSTGIVRTHQGNLFLESDCKNTQFVVILPKMQKASNQSHSAA